MSLTLERTTGENSPLSNVYWNKDIPAQNKIKEIEDDNDISHIKIQGSNEPKINEIEKIIKLKGIQILRNPFQVQKLVFELLKLAKDEILVIFSTANAFHRQEKTGALGLLFDIATKNSLNIKIMTPVDDKIKEKKKQLENIKIINEVDDNTIQLEEISQKKHIHKQTSKNIQIRFIERQQQTTISILIVDKKYSLAVELKDDTQETMYEAIGLATFSNSKSTVLSYVSMFETLWLQTELCDRLTKQDKIQKEFIDIAAHELRTPIQPIIAITEILYSQNKNEDYQELLGVVLRNAKRLKRLTEDLLDVAKIESNTLKLNKEMFNLEEVISGIIAQYKTDIKEIDNTIDLKFLPEEKDLYMEGDKGRISQVIDNLLCNSIKFTEDVNDNGGGGDNITSNITVIAKKEGNDRIKVITKDTGIGIDREIMPRLFTKFATKSDKGTGLGLYISKKIIEAHAGEIWGKNNDNGIGAEFGFVLPIRNT
jgi:two-component system, OmpR family, sensor histidine kinase VicK